MTIIDGAKLKLAQEINMPDGVIAMNIFYFRADFTSEQTEADVLTAFTAWVEGVYNEVVNEISDQVSLGDLTGYVYNTLLDQWDNIGSATPTKVGTEVTDMLPHGVAALVRAYSTNPRSIARKYIPGFGEDQQTDGTWVAGALTTLAAFGDAWSTLTVLSAGNVLHPGVFDTTLKIVHILTGTEVVLVEPAYQRRRRPGVGS